MIKRTLLTVVAAAGLALAASAPALAAQPYPINFKNFPLGSYASISGVTESGGTVTLASTGLGSFTYTDPFANYSNDGANGSGPYQSGTWTSPDYSTSFGFNELVASWNATTPNGTWIQVEMQPKMLDGHWAKWYILGRWSSSDSDFHRTSVGGQGDADGFVSIDTWFAKDHVAVAYRLKVTLFRRAGSSATPTLTRLNAVAMNLTNQKMTFPSATHDDGAERPRPPAVLAGDPPRRLPAVRQRRRGVVQPDVDVDGRLLLGLELHADADRIPVGHDALGASTTTRGSTTPPARSTTTTTTAPATGRSTRRTRPRGARRGRDGAAQPARGRAVHQRRRPARRSVAWESNKLDGGIKSTNGHLMVIGGFTANGNVIAYDPAPTRTRWSGTSTTASSSSGHGSRRAAASCTSSAPRGRTSTRC
jgi:hypothetical protein